MAEPIYARVRRLMMTGVEELTDALERVGGKGVMREAIREVDRAIEETRAAYVAASARRHQAARQQTRLRERLSDLEDKARYAMRERREDLAEAAVAQHVDLEDAIKRLDAAQADASKEIAELEACLASLKERKERMEADLAAFEAAERDAVGSTGGVGPSKRTQDRVERAEATLARMMGQAGQAVRSVGAEAAKLGEIDALQRASTVARRMASLREGWPRA